MEYSGSKLQAAIQWVNERRRGHRDLALPVLLEDAARQFDLGLSDQRELMRVCRDR